MRRTILIYIGLGTLYALTASGSARANRNSRALGAQDPQQQQSLGDIARQARKAKEERDKSATAPTKVFTDENFPTGGSAAANKADLARMDSPQATPSDRMATARAMLDRAGRELDTLDPMDRATLAKAALQGREGDFPGRRAWEDKLFASKQRYVAHGRDLIRQVKEVLTELEALTTGGKISPSDPRAQELALKARRFMQDAYQTEADFQGVVLEGAELAKQAASSH
jgi:hypothetical protein